MTTENMIQIQIENQIAEIAEITPIVAARSDELRAAREAETSAEAALLERLRDVVRPALRALSSRVAIGERTWWPDNSASTSRSEHATWRGLQITGSNGPDFDHPRANDGAYEGWDLYLAVDGTWRRLRYSGSWSRWQGADSSWESAETTLTDREVAAKYDIPEIVEAIAGALRKQRDGATPKATEAALDRAARVSALAMLMGGAR